MATEILVKESLSREMISAGAELIRLLDEAHFKASASLWFYELDANAWRLIIASPNVELDGPKKAYKQIQSVIAKMPEGQSKIELKDITVVDSKDSLILLLRRFVKAEGTHGIRLLNNMINGSLIEDAYIYRLT